MISATDGQGVKMAASPWTEPIKVIGRANEEPGRTWSVCRYTRGRQTLVIASAATPPEHSQTLYMVFGGTTAMSLPWWLGSAHFELASPDQLENDIGVLRAIAAADAQAVRIQADKQSYWVVCRSLAMYAVDSAEDS